MQSAAHTVSTAECNMRWGQLLPEGNKPLSAFGHIWQQGVKCLNLGHILCNNLKSNSA